MTPDALMLTPLPASVRTARRLVRDWCRDRCADPSATDWSVLLTSELVTGALLRGIGPIAVSVTAPAAGRLRVEVSGEAAFDPHGPAPLLLDGLAGAWGMSSTGTAVWFELALVSQPVHAG